MIRNQYGFKWNSYYRSDYGDEETIALMKEAGCEGVYLGVESGSDQVLKNMNKKVRRTHHIEAIPLLKDAGIITHTNFIVGFPGETHDTVNETLDLINTVEPDFFRAQLWYCDPVTPIWKERDRYGITGEAFHWYHNTMDYKTAFKLLEENFFLNDSSVWMPQNGFEVWSIFYLQRRGMRIEQVKTFLRSFHAAVTEKILYPDRGSIDSLIIDNLKYSCQFDRGKDAGLKPATDEELALLG